MNSENYYWMYEDSIFDSVAQKGDVSIPQGAEITATVSFQYDGDLLGADDNQHPNPDSTYTQEYTTADGPIEFERTVTIGNREYRYPVYYISLKEANLPEPSSGNAFDFTSTEVQTIDRVNVFSPNNSEILFNLTKGKINSPIVRVACESSMGSRDADKIWEETGEILDHFTISMKDISGTLTLWK